MAQFDWTPGRVSNPVGVQPKGWPRPVVRSVPGARDHPHPPHSNEGAGGREVKNERTRGHARHRAPPPRKEEAFRLRLELCVLRAEPSSARGDKPPSRPTQAVRGGGTAGLVSGGADRQESSGGEDPGSGAEQARVPCGEPPDSEGGRRDRRAPNFDGGGRVSSQPRRTPCRNPRGPGRGHRRPSWDKAWNGSLVEGVRPEGKI
jgi:hypothetical protein